jgi:hypothetical protein
MPQPKQTEKPAGQAPGTKQISETSPQSMPAEYWDAVLTDPQVRANGIPIQHRRLSEIPRHVLRVDCHRCDRTVEIQMADAVRLFGERAVWKDVGQRLLDNTCQQRTGRYEEDGCWPSFGSS